MAEHELIDKVDRDGNIIGTAPRSEFHKNPNLIHRVVHCWIFNSNGQILWQQRSLKKVQSPGKWDMSCGGHVLSGDEPYDTLIRELKEELGIENVDPIFIEKYIDGDQNQTELIYLYYLLLDQKDIEFVLQAEEVEKVEWIDIHKAMLMVLNHEREATHWIFDQVPRIFQKIFKERLK